MIAAMKEQLKISTVRLFTSQSLVVYTIDEMKMTGTMNWKDAAQWMNRLKQGESAAQSQVYSDCFGEMYGVCRRILGDGPDAMDTAVDVLSDFIFVYAKKLKRAEGMRSYLRLMAVRRSLRVRDRRNSASSGPLERMSAEGQDPEEQAHQTLLQPRLEECLQTLTPKAQQVIRLRFGHEMTNEKIGGLVGGSKQYIGKLISNCLKMLQKCLKRDREMAPHAS